MEDLSLLLRFDDQRKGFGNRPFHSMHKIDILEGSKTWREARLSWRRKVRELYGYLGQKFPPPEGFNAK